jgi:hypothetical protein
MNNTEQNEHLRSRLTIALTAYDYSIQARHLRNVRVYHNPFALGLYFEAVDRVIAEMNSGQSLRNALENAFTGSLLRVLLRKAGVRDAEIVRA